MNQDTSFEQEQLIGPRCKNRMVDHVLPDHFYIQIQIANDSAELEKILCDFVYQTEREFFEQLSAVYTTMKCRPEHCHQIYKAFNNFFVRARLLELKLGQPQYME